MNLPASMSDQPSTNGRGFVGGVVVHHQMDIEIERNIGLDFTQELEELASAMAREAFSDHLPRRNIKGREQGQSAMTGIVAAASLGLSRTHRQDRLGAIQCLKVNAAPQRSC